MRWFFRDKALKRAFDKYEFGLSELEPALRKRILSQAAFQLWRDYRALVTSGIEERLVLQKMAPGIETLMRNASSAATSLPETIQPVVQKAIELGLVEHHSGLTFFTSLRTAIEELWDSNASVVLMASSVVAAGVFLFTDAVDLGDANSYLIYSYAISQLRVNPGVYFRTSGYPLLLTASLYPWTGSLIGILALQAVFAALIPYYIYKLFGLISERLALVAGLVSILTLLPFNYQVLIYPDQTELFLTIAFTYYLTRYSLSAKPRDLIPAFATIALLSLLRPTLVLFFLLLLAAVAVHSIRRFRSAQRLEGLLLFGGLTLGLVALHASFSAADRFSYRRAHAVKRSMDGRQLFFNMYLYSADVKGALADGTYTMELRRKLEQYFQHPPPQYADVRRLRPEMGDRYYEKVFAPFRTNPKGQVDALLSTHDVTSYWVLFNISDIAWGPEGDGLFFKVAVEQYRRHPAILWNSVSEGLVGYLWRWPCDGPGPLACIYYPVNVKTFPPSHGWPQVGPWLGMKSHTEAIVGHGLVAEVGTPIRAAINAEWPKFYAALVPVTSSLSLVGLLVVAAVWLFGLEPQRIRRETILLTTVVGMWALYVIPMSLLVNLQFRYQSAAALVAVSSALISIQLVLLVLGQELFDRGRQYRRLPARTVRNVGLLALLAVVGIGAYYFFGRSVSSASAVTSARPAVSARPVSPAEYNEPPYSAEDLPSVRPNQVLQFADGQNRAALLEGWSGAEPVGVWSTAKDAFLGLRISHGSTPLPRRVVMKVMPHLVPRKLDAQRVEVWSGHHQIFKLTLMNKDSEFSIPLTQAAVNVNGSLIFRLYLPDARSPLEVEGRADPRTQAIFLKSIQLMP